MESLFEEEAGGPAEGQTRVPARDQPLAARMRPATLDELAGQGHLLEPGSALRTALEEGNPHSMVLFGPPGTGKTTIARLMAVAGGAQPDPGGAQPDRRPGEHRTESSGEHRTETLDASAAFEELSAVNAGRAEVREVLERAGHRRTTSGQPTILFLDEIHRFNKAQQDVLLPAVEEGLVTLVGATTENPYFEVNSALLSRCRVYELHPLSDEEVAGLIRRALGHERGVVDPPEVADAAIDFLAARAGGDARTALAALELAAETAGDEGVTLEVAEDALQRRAVLYDKGGDRHYDTISAWIKATRGSDPDASLLYLAIMLEGGEDPRFIARRMVILASEDIGNADPQAIQVAVATAHAVEHVGLPECAHNLAQATVYLSLAPKSNASYEALGRARRWVRENGAPDPPAPMRSAAYPGAKALGRGQDYDYPHSHPEGVSSQELMPAEAGGERFLELSEHGGEPEMAKRLAAIRRSRGLS